MTELCITNFSGIKSCHCYIFQIVNLQPYHRWGCISRDKSSAFSPAPCVSLFSLLSSLSMKVISQTLNVMYLRSCLILFNHLEPDDHCLYIILYVQHTT